MTSQDAGRYYEPQWATLFSPRGWSTILDRREKTHVGPSPDRSKLMPDQSEPMSETVETGRQIPRWAPTVAASLLSAAAASGGFYALSLEKWDRFDDADRVHNARLLKLEEGQLTITTQRVKEFSALKISVGRIIANHVAKLGVKQTETAKALAVLVEAQERAEDSSTERDARLETALRDFQIRMDKRP